MIKKHFGWFKSFDDVNCEVTNTKKCINKKLLESSKNVWNLGRWADVDLTDRYEDVEKFTKEEAEGVSVTKKHVISEHYFSHQNLRGLKYLLIELVVHMLKIIV